VDPVTVSLQQRLQLGSDLMGPLDDSAQVLPLLLT
jgi:hypothetical protein